MLEFRMYLMSVCSLSDAEESACGPGEERELPTTPAQTRVDLREPQTESSQVTHSTTHSYIYLHIIAMDVQGPEV